MDHPVKHVHHSLIRKGLFTPGTRLLLGVSGGIDSVAMVHIFRRIVRLQRVELTVGHFNHRLRGKDSDRDAVFVRKLCLKHRIPFFEGGEDIRNICRNTPGKSLEEVARERRFNFFWEIMEKEQCQYLLLGHTCDDQVETFLMRFLQGSGAQGLGGISFYRKFSRGVVIHPLLGIKKKELTAFLKENNYSWREDITNQEKYYLRNQLRLELIPHLKKFNPRIKEFITGYTNYFQELSIYLEKVYAAWEKEACALQQDNSLYWDARVISSWPVFQQKEFIYRYFKNHFNRTLKSEQIAQIWRFINISQSGKKLSILEDIHLNKEYHNILIKNNEVTVPETPSPIIIKDTGTYQWHHWNIVVERAPYDTMPDENSLLVPAGQKYILRGFKPGDKITFSRPPITKKLKKIFQENKVPLSHRKFVPLLCSGDDKTILAVFLRGGALFSSRLMNESVVNYWILRITMIDPV